ncbi:MAG: hypothetical protein KDE33_27650, partial [Bacteroidetes bacterium]|nr:hypothetical protein [Bacteroidota bacterium]
SIDIVYFLLSRLSDISKNDSKDFLAAFCSAFVGNSITFSIANCCSCVNINEINETRVANLPNFNLDLSSFGTQHPLPRAAEALTEKLEKC